MKCAIKFLFSLLHLTLMLSTNLCLKMIAKLILFNLSVVLLIQYSITENVTELPTTTSDLITTLTQEVTTMTTTVETTTAATVMLPSEATATLDAIMTDTTLKPKSRKARKRRKPSKAAIKKYIELLDFTIAEVMSVADLTLSVTKQLFQDVILDVSNYEDGHNDLVNENINILNAFNAKVDEVQNANDTLGKLDLVEKLERIMEKFNGTTACSNTTIEDQTCAVEALFYGAFKQHDMGSLEAQVQERNLLFLENFKNAADKFWNSLSPRDQKKGIQFHEWLTEFKSAQDADTKFDYLWMWFDI